MTHNIENKQDEKMHLLNKMSVDACTRLNSNGIMVSRELHNCQHGEKNRIVNETYCNRYKEFCKFICDCPIKQLG